MEPECRLIVVEDDPITRSMIATYFAKEGFEVGEAGSAGECWDLLRQRQADLLFIDIELPDGSGLVLAREIRAISPVGIIFVTQRDDEVDLIVGLEVAADDYVTKPVNLRELLARARALLRRRRIERAAAVTKPEDGIAFRSWILDPTRRELTARDGTPIDLTRGEFDLLAALIAAAGKPVGRYDLAELVSSRDAEGNVRTVDNLVSRLRRKLAPDAIVTVTGIGYKLGAARD